MADSGSCRKLKTELKIVASRSHRGLQIHALNTMILYGIALAQGQYVLKMGTSSDLVARARGIERLLMSGILFIHEGWLLKVFWGIFLSFCKCVLLQNSNTF